MALRAQEIAMGVPVASVPLGNAPPAPPATSFARPFADVTNATLPRHAPVPIDLTKSKRQDPGAWVKDFKGRMSNMC
jgi:hypothetical protein